MKIVVDDHETLSEWVRLNEEWISAHFSLEESDRDLAENPEAVLERGGHVLAAIEDDRVVGAAALFQKEAGSFELARMAVKATEQGKGTGRLLARAALRLARELGASRISLLSNTKLAPALALYWSLGFTRSACGSNTGYSRCNIKMEKQLDSSHDLDVVRLQQEHIPSLVEAVRQSTALHHPWVTPPDTQQEMAEYLNCNPEQYVRYGLKTDDGKWAGVINLNAIVRGAFHNAFLGYFSFVPFAGRGFMKEGLRRVMRLAFEHHELHRLEANIQSENRRSIELVKSLRFRHEGFSPRYLKIGDRWQDHERFAMTKEELEGVG